MTSYDAKFTENLQSAVFWTKPIICIRMKVRKKMQKKLILVLFAVVGGLPFSCSEYILPKRVEVAGTVSLPVRVGVTDFSTEFMDILQNAFPGDARAGESSRIEVFNVDYKKQTVLTFCIYLPIEMTEDLNPTAFLKTISTQINNNISAEPRRIDPINMPVPPGGIPVSLVTLPSINPVFLDNIAKYVKQINFKKCDETIVNGKVVSGIGLNFYLDKVVNGLEMIIECDELHFSSQPKLLKPGNNIFGNTEDFILALAGYEDKSKKLEFTMRVQSASPNPPGYLIDGLTTGSMVTVMEGKVEFFQNWTEATIDMETAVKASRSNENFIGTFPSSTGNGGFNMSELGDYLDGDFTFDGLETKIYMNNPVSFKMRLALDPQYTGKESVEPLYDDEFGVDDEPFALSDYLKDGNYVYEHLPGIDDDDVSVNDNAVIDIFNKMPENLYFEYRLRFTESDLKVTPDMFNDSGEQSKIDMALMIMLPFRLVAINDRSVVTFPGMFGESDDLFGRDEIDESDDFFESVKIKKIRMTVDFLYPIFSGGRLFIDGDKNTNPLLFYPNGIKMSKKKMIMDFTNSQMEVIQNHFIKPNLWIKLDEGDTVTIPKKMGVVNVKIQMKGSVEVEDILE